MKEEKSFREANDSDKKKSSDGVSEKMLAEVLKSDTKCDTKSDTKADTKNDTKTDTKSKSKTDTKSLTKADTKSNAETEQPIKSATKDGTEILPKLTIEGSASAVPLSATDSKIQSLIQNAKQIKTLQENLGKYDSDGDGTLNRDELFRISNSDDADPDCKSAAKAVSDNFANVEVLNPHRSIWTSSNVDAADLSALEEMTVSQAALLRGVAAFDTDGDGAVSRDEAETIRNDKNRSDEDRRIANWFYSNDGVSHRTGDGLLGSAYDKGISQRDLIEEARSNADAVGEKSIVNDVDLIHYQFNPVAIPLPTEEDTLAVLRGKTQDELSQMNDIYKEKYGISLRDETNARMSSESCRRANAMFAGEADPGYLSPTNEDAQSALTAFNNSPAGGKTLDYYIDADQLKAIQKNEVAKRGIEDDWQDYWNTPGSTKGPAQISDALVKELREDPRYKDALDGADPNTVSGAQKFMAAHMSQWVDRLNQGYFKTRAAEKLREAEQPEQSDAARNKLREDAAWMNAQQERWDTAVANGDRDTTRKMLARRWNPGHGEQEEEVEAQRNATPTDSRYARMYSTVRNIA